MRHSPLMSIRWQHSLLSYFDLISYSEGLGNLWTGFTPSRLLSSGTRGFRSTTATRIAVGEKLPNVLVHGKNPSENVDVQKLFSEHKRAILFGVPGAFTPGCSKSHLPGFLARLKDFQSKGVSLIACITVNDSFVAQAWAREHNADKQSCNGLNVTMLADAKADFVKAANLHFDATGPLGGVRSKRFAMIVENGVVKKLNVEPDNTGLSCSLAENVVKEL